MDWETAVKAVTNAREHAKEFEAHCRAVVDCLKQVQEDVTAILDGCAALDQEIRILQTDAEAARQETNAALDRYRATSAGLEAEHSVKQLEFDKITASLEAAKTAANRLIAAVR